MKNPKQTTPSTLDRMTHDILNRLTVISLCASELRNSTAEKLESDQLKEFKRLEVAVQEAAGMIQQLRASVPDHRYLATHRRFRSALNRLKSVDNRYPILSRLTFLR